MPTLYLLVKLRHFVAYAAFCRIMPNDKITVKREMEKSNKNATNF